MNTAEADPVSLSELQGRPRSYSLLPMSLEPEMDIGEEREMMLPTRVGMLKLWAWVRVARMAVRMLWESCILMIGMIYS